MAVLKCTSRRSSLVRWAPTEPSHCHGTCGFNGVEHRAHTSSAPLLSCKVRTPKGRRLCSCAIIAKRQRGGRGRKEGRRHRASPLPPSYCPHNRPDNKSLQSGGVWCFPYPWPCKRVSKHWSAPIRRRRFCTSPSVAHCRQKIHSWFLPIRKTSRHPFGLFLTFCPYTLLSAPTLQLWFCTTFFSHFARQVPLL